MGIETNSFDPQVPKGVGPSLLRGLCIVGWFYSTFVYAHGVMMVCQEFGNNIPRGVIASTKSVKGGTEVSLRAGEHGVVPTYVLFAHDPKIELKPGDTVEKAQGDFKYIINGETLVDRRWTLQQWLTQPHMLVMAGLYFIPSVVYAAWTRRVAWSDFVYLNPRKSAGRNVPPPESRPPPKAHPFFISGVLRPLSIWLITMFLEILFFSCVIYGVCGALSRLFSNS